MRRSASAAFIVAAAIGVVVGPWAAAQPSGINVVRVAPEVDPDSPAGKAYAAAQKKRLAVEKELKTIRAKHFKTMKNVEIRQAGIGKLKSYTDPATFPLLLEIFAFEDHDVREAILDHLTDQETDEADAVIAWGAVHDEDKWFREEAGKRVVERSKKAGISNRVKSAIAAGLQSKDKKATTAAANLAAPLKLYEAIPMLINAQVQGGNGGGGGGGDGDGDGALAWILIGTQIAFVSDLQPVVGDSAVGFDPTLSVVTDGVVMRIDGAVVTTYLTEVHQALVDLSTEGWGGRTTAGLGWDQRKWHKWYTDEFKPFRAKLEAESAAKTDQARKSTFRGVRPAGGPI